MLGWCVLTLVWAQVACAGTLQNDERTAQRVEHHAHVSERGAANRRSSTLVPGTEIQVNSYDSLQQERPTVLALDNSEFLVLWDSEGQDGDGWGVTARRFSSGPTPSPLGSETLININTANNQLIAGAARLVNGGYVVSYDSTGQNGEGTGYSDILARVFPVSGVPSGEIIVPQITAGHQTESSVAALLNGDFVVTWTTNGLDWQRGDLKGRRFSSSGAAVTAEFQINPPEAYVFAQNVAALSTGGFVVVWNSRVAPIFTDYYVFVQLYASDSTAIGTAFQVSTNTDPQPVAVCSFSNGFMVVWQNLDSDYNIYGQRFANDGTSLGSIFQVNTITTGDQITPNVTCVSSGACFVTYQGVDTSGTGIYAQLFAADGTKDGAEFLVNSNEVGDQRFSHAAFVGNELIVAWTGPDSSGDGIFLRSLALPTPGKKAPPTVGKNKKEGGKEAKVVAPAVAGVVGVGATVFGLWKFRKQAKSKKGAKTQPVATQVYHV